MKAAIVVGSDSDLPVIKEASDMLEKFGIEYIVSVTSAHRTPDKVHLFMKEAEKQGCEVIIAAAGMAAHLPGVIASLTTLPVIGVPMQGGALDALYAIVQMPSGIPVATVAVGKAGAANAGILAAQILAIKYPVLKEKLINFKKELAKKVEEKDAKLQELGIKKYIDGKKQ
jgi:5-(carboxyamino)imidazole ribonucleotide mutase